MSDRSRKGVIVVVAKREKELEVLMKRLQKYLDRKMLTLNAEKSKWCLRRGGEKGNGNGDGKESRLRQSRNLYTWV